jgi:hypothetical protein
MRAFAPRYAMTRFTSPSSSGTRTHRSPSACIKGAKRRERLSGRYLEAFDEALDWAKLGRIGVSGERTDFATTAEYRLPKP